MVYSFRETLGLKVVKALKRKDDGISHAAVDTLCALMQVGVTISYHDNYVVSHSRCMTILICG